MKWKNKRSFKPALVIVLILQFCSGLHAQPYGLNLSGNEVINEQRTSLILGDGYQICTGNNFSLEFDFKLNNYQENYFGYIFRLLDKDQHNFDLIFNGELRFVYDEQSIPIEFNTDSSSLFTRTNHLKLTFDLAENQLIAKLNDSRPQAVNIKDLKLDCFEIYFGHCTRAGYRNSDVISLRLSDVSITSNMREVNHWKLNEENGIRAKDSKGNITGKVINPNWTTKNYSEWNLVTDLTWPGIISVADRKNGIEIFSENGIQYYSFSHDSLGVLISEGVHHLTYGDAAINLHHEGKHGILRLNSKEIFMNDGKSINIPPSDDLTEYWHHNIYVFPEDTALIALNGYGMYTYKNIFQKYSFKTGLWTEQKLKGDIPTPRYLSGLGSSKNDLSSYLLGGFGSNSGDQLIKPQNYYDLYKIDWSTNTIEQIYEFENDQQDPFVFGSNLVINEEENSLYALAFNQLNYNTELQLMEFSLENPEFTRLGNRVPFEFQDIRTQVSLHEGEGALYCSVIHYDDNENTSSLKIYSIQTPPVPFKAGMMGSSKNWLFIPVFVALALLGFVFYRKQKQKATNEDVATTSDFSKEVPVVSYEETITKPMARIRLFGKFQVLNADGTDVSKSFTPLLKEIFLYLLLNSLRYNKGMSSDKLDETFWYDKSKSSARNNRSVNIIKLKGLLAQIGGIELNKKTGNWEIIYDNDKIIIDYAELLSISAKKEKISKQEAANLSHIVSTGTFLPNLEYEWLDSFKSETSNNVIDSLLAYANRLQVKNSAEELIEIADKIFLFDAIDESAMMMKCKSLHHLGKHSLAKKAYESFVKKYEDLLSEKYAYSFSEVLEYQDEQTS